MIFEVDVGGQLFEVDAPSQKDAIEAASQIGAPRPSGMANNIGAGLAEGVVGLATSPATALEALSGGNIGGTNKAAWDAIERWTGPRPEAKTTREKYARTVAEFVPGSLVGPGGMTQKALTYGVVPGLTSEYFKQRAEGSGYEGASGIAGALLGTAGGAGINRLATSGKNYLAARSAAGDIQSTLGVPIGPGAARRVADNLGADRIVPSDVARLQSELGPEGMLMDIGRQTKGRAEAIATQPGRGQSAVLDAVEGRTGRFGAGTAQRVAQTLDAEMGPTHNVVQLVDRVNEAVDRHARPLYQKVMAAHPVVDVPPEISSRPAIRSAMANAKELAANYGETITIDARPSLRAWDYVKKDLDRRINAYQRTGGSSELSSADKADMGGLMDARRALVGHLDSITRGEYKQARQVAATKFELREALDYGRDAFNSRLLPEEFADELSQMSLPQQRMAQVGFRRELDRLVETTRNEGATARRILDTNSVLQKTELLFGQQAAREIERRIAAENTFQEATQDIARNSRTAVRTQLQKDTSTPSTNEIRSASMTGLGLAGLRGTVNYARQHGMERTRDQIGDILTARGGDIDPIVRALLQLGDKRTANSAAVGNRTTSLINALISGQ